MRRFHSQNPALRIETLGSIPLSLIFLCAFLAFAHPDLDDYVPGVKVTQSTTLVANPEKHPKRDLGHSIRVIVSSQRFTFTTVFINSFLKFDRKQNTRLWPLVTASATRAPPVAFSL
jgi:hypothetical protein